MKSRAVSVILGAVVASSFSTPCKFGGPADAADAVRPPRPEMVKIPEFVPVVNFSQFVLAMQTFVAENPPAARIAAEALSAKFASNLDAQKSDAQKVEPPTQPRQQEAALAPAKLSSIIVTRPVAVVADIPAVPDPSQQAPAVADPVKIVTGYPAPRRHKADKIEKAEKADKSERKIATASRPRLEKKFEPAMGLGMVIDSAENAPPMSALAQKKKISGGKISSRQVTARGAQLADSTGSKAEPASEDDAHVGIQGQSMAPLVSKCTKVQRACVGYLCGC